jgi:hypothetical protein
MTWRKVQRLAVGTGCGILLMLGSAAWAQGVSVGFETSEGYSTGNLVGQLGWYYGEAGSMLGTVIDTDNAGGGFGQCVEFTAITSGRIHLPFTPILFGSGVLVTFEYDMRVMNATTMASMDFRPRVLDFANGDLSYVGITCGHNFEAGGINNSWYGSKDPTGSPVGWNNEAQVNPKMLDPLPDAQDWSHYKWVVYFGTGLGDGVGRLLYGELNGVRYPWMNAYVGAPVSKLDRLQFRGAAGAGVTAIVRIDNVAVSAAAFTPTPPTVSAGPDASFACGDVPTIAASGSVDVERWVVLPSGGTEGNTSVANDVSSPVELPKWCQETRTYQVYSVDVDGVWSTAPDLVDITVGDYGSTQFAFSTVTAPANGDWYSNSLASSGTYLYWIKGPGEFRRTANGSSWQTLNTPPDYAWDWNNPSGSLAYTSSLGSQGSLLGYARPGGIGELLVYDVATGSWTGHANDKFGTTGFVVAGTDFFGNLNAADTNQGGPLAHIDLTDLDAPYCTRSSLKGSMQGQDAWWFSRVTQMANVGGMLYGIKNDWQTNPRGTGDRFYRFDPADFAPNFFIGPDWDDWSQPANLTPAEDLGALPIEPGYGSAVVALPPNWKSPVIGALGGVFVLFGRTNADLEGWGGVTDRYGVYDIAQDKWTLGILPAFSSSGSAACFHNGEVWIKQGCSNATNPEADPTPTFWVTGAVIPPIDKPVADAGPDQGPMPPQVITLDGTGSYATAPGATITAYTWTYGSQVIGTGPTPQVILPDGQASTVALVVRDSNGVNSDPDTVTITLEDCGSSASGWFNDFTSTAGVSGPYPVYIQTIYGKTGVAMDVNDADGYYGLDVRPVCPFDATAGKITITLRNGGTNLPGTVGWWLRLHTVNSGYRGYAFNVPGDGQWYTLSACIDDPSPGEQNPQFDPTQITDFRIESVVWGGTADYTMGVADVTFAQLPAPVANAGPDQNVTGTCGQLKTVTLDGSGSQNATSYTWFEGGVQIATGQKPNVQLLSGVHYIELEIQGSDPCSRDTDEVMITVGGGLPPPVELPMDTQINYSNYGKAIYQPVYGTDPLYPWWSGYSEVAEIYVGVDIYGNPTNWTTGYMLVGQSWYHGPWVRLLKTCYGTQDLSDPDARLKFTARYFQDADNWACDPADPNCSPKPYQDAPIMVTLRDTYGKRGCLGVCYGPNFYDQYIDGQPNPLYGQQYPLWLNIDVNIQEMLATHPGVGDDLSDDGFDLSKVVRIEFMGTDWGGTGWDETNIRDLWVSVEAPAVCTGDLNCDGSINFGDINPFVQYVSNYAAWVNAHPGCNPLNGDTNCDGTYGQSAFGDINPFVRIITQCGVGCSCPGPYPCP